MKQAAQSLSAIILVALLAVTLPPSLPAHEGQAGADKERGEEYSQPQSKAMEEGDAAPTFVLVDQDRKRIALSDLNGRPRFLTFIHTHCKDVCPLILRNRRQLEQQVEPAIGTRIIFLAVTMDPEHDSPKVLKAFIRKTGVDTKDLHLLTGDVQTVRKVLNEYNIGVVRDATTGYVEGHSTVGYAIDKEGIIKKIYNFSFEQL